MEKLPPLLIPVLQGVRRKHIQKGQIILYQGDSTLDAYVLNSGVVKMYDIDENGNEKVLHLAKRPAVIPFVFFSGATLPSHWFYSALTDCEVYAVPQLKLFKALHDDSQLAMYLMNWFSQEVHEILTRLSSLGKTNAHDKLVVALRYLAMQHGIERRTGWRRISFPVNHQLLADMVGITRESTALAMKELQDQKIIRNPRQTILEINKAKLEGLATAAG